MIVVEIAEEATWDPTSAGGLRLLFVIEDQVVQLREAIHLLVLADIHRQTTSLKQSPGSCLYCQARRYLLHTDPFSIQQASSTSFKLQSFLPCPAGLGQWAEDDNHEADPEARTEEATMEVAVGLTKGSTSLACSTENLLHK
jgi:hypothetical protein